MYNYDLDIRDAVSVSGPVTQQHFGANYVYNYERFGEMPWEKYDELIENIGLTNIRYPGGNSIETNFDFTNPNSPTNMWGQTVTPLNEFIEFIGSRDLDATIIIPTRPFLPGESHEFLTYSSAENSWVVDPAKFAAVEADIVQFVKTIMDEAATHGARIYAIELGNEYPGVDWTTPSGEPSKMNAKQYGEIANALAKTVQETIDSINAEQNGAGQDPQIVAQIWGDYNQGGMSTDQLKSANENVISRFDSEGLAAIDAVSDHLYFKNLKTSSAGEMHSYDTLSTMISDMLSMSEKWNIAAGRDLDKMISEWNIQKFGFHDPGFEYWDENDSWVVTQEWIDTSTFGLKQVAPVLEMFSAFLAGGVDSAHIWSVMYSATALGTHMNNGQLFVAGGLMDLMQDELLGTRYVEFGHQTEDHDIHVYEDDDSGHVFVSSLTRSPQEITLNLKDFGGSIEDVKVQYLRADVENSDAQYTINGMTYILPDTEHAFLEMDLSLLIENGQVMMTGDEITVELGAFETAYISFDRDGFVSKSIEGSSASAGNSFLTDGAAFSAALHGDKSHDTVDGHLEASALTGTDGNDRLDGSDGSDAIYGDDGNDVIRGGEGDDRGNVLWGSFGMEKPDDAQANNDTLEGGAGNDFLVGGSGNDRLDGGEGNDVLSGGLHSDTFVFDGDFGHDVITDFDSKEDQIAISSPEALTTRTKEELVQEFARELGSDVIIELDEERSITLRDTTIDDLEEADMFIA